MAMTKKQKVAACSALAAFLGWVGVNLGCDALPTEYRGICVIGKKGAATGADAIKAHIACEPAECVGDVSGAIIQRGQSNNYCACP